MEKEKDKEQELITEDSFIAAALLEQKDLIKEVTPFLKSNNPPRVAFSIKGDVRAALDRISGNSLIGVRDYITAAKGLRNSIFLLKNTAHSSGQK